MATDHEPAIYPDGWRLRRLSGTLGAELSGLKLAGMQGDEIHSLRSLLNEHQVLFFPDQHLSPDEHLAFGRQFGELESHPNLQLGGERPEFFELRAISGTGAVADEWHSDLSCQPQPSVMAILHMKACPEFGGDTLWSNMYMAYECLSAPLRELCDGLTAMHDAGPHLHAERTAIHPVVRVHPDTGRRSLFVNQHFTRRIVEMSHEESDMLLNYLTRWASSHRFTLRYHWRPGTIAMWDNRCTQHFVMNDFEGERVIQRVTVMGDQPQAAEPRRWPAYSTLISAGSWRDQALGEGLRKHKKAQREAEQAPAN